LVKEKSMNQYNRIYSILERSITSMGHRGEAGTPRAQDKLKRSRARANARVRRDSGSIEKDHEGTIYRTGGARTAETLLQRNPKNAAALRTPKALLSTKNHLKAAALAIRRGSPRKRWGPGGTRPLRFEEPK
jgi:hypothetical protein